MPDQEPTSKTALALYVIMPFSKTSTERTKDYWDEHFEHFIKKSVSDLASTGTLAEYDWRITRSSVDKGGALNYEIVWDLLTTPVVIADLTDLNSNVLYELGVRHALTAAVGIYRTIMIQDESVFKLPFDFTNYSVIPYDKNRVDSWKKNLNRRLIECLQNQSYRDNPVSMTFAQHNFSLQQTNRQQENVKNMQMAVDVLERLVKIGLSPQWIEQMLSASTGVQPKPPTHDKDKSYSNGIK